jgi:hypothetical protein
LSEPILAVYFVGQHSVYCNHNQYFPIRNSQLGEVNPLTAKIIKRTVCSAVLCLLFITAAYLFVPLPINFRLQRISSLPDSITLLRSGHMSSEYNIPQIKITDQSEIAKIIKTYNNTVVNHAVGNFPSSTGDKKYRYTMIFNDGKTYPLVIVDRNRMMGSSKLLTDFNVFNGDKLIEVLDQETESN